MQIRLLEILRCPLTGEKLNLHVDREVVVERDAQGARLAFGDASELRREIIEGKLISEKSGNTYPIVAGVPRMLVDETLPDPTSVNLSLSRPDQGLSKEYRQTVGHFRTQWETFGEDSKSFGRTVAGSWEYFRLNLSAPEVPDEWFRGKLVIDAGCGHGKYVDALSTRGIDMVGFDITPEIERVYKRVGSRANVNLVHANVLYPPFERRRADAVFSNGVIHHTPDTRGGFRAVAELVRPGGYLSIWVYPYRGAGFEIVSQSLRAITTRLPSSVLRPLCYLPVPLLSLPGWGAYSGTSLRNASWRECSQVVYDFFGPKYQTHHRPEEVERWYGEEGFPKVWFRPDELSAVGQRISTQ